MKEVFISYSTKDYASAETVRDVLETNGLSCWMAPRDIPGGSNYTKEIPIAIRGCSVFVLILSANAQSSHWVLKELDSAVNAGKVILPFMLEDCILNDEFNFLLTGAQRYAAYQKKAEALETLIRRVRGILNAPDEPVQISSQSKAAVTHAPISGAACPSCGGTDLKAQSYRIKRHGAELVSMFLLVPAFAFVLGLITLLVFSLALPMDAFRFFGWAMLASLAIGGFLGDLLSRSIVRRKRLRQRIDSNCYRCNRCRHIFRHDIPLN